MQILDRFNRWTDSALPIAEDCRGTYQYMAGVMVVLGAAAGEQVLEQAENGTLSSKPVLFVGTVALTAMTGAASALFWDRNWKSEGE